MISHRRQVIHDYLYGARDVETDRPVKEDTTFGISSISNLVTGVADQAAQLDVGTLGYSFDTGTEDIDNALRAYNILTANYRDGRYQLAIMMLLCRPGSSFQAAEDISALKRDSSYSPLFSLCLAGRWHGYSRITSRCPRSMRNWPTGFEPALSLGISLPARSGCNHIIVPMNDQQERLSTPIREATNAHPGRHRRLSSRRSPHPKRVSKDTAA